MDFDVLKVWEEIIKGPWYTTEECLKELEYRIRRDEIERCHKVLKEEA